MRGDMAELYGASDCEFDFDDAFDDEDKYGEVGDDCKEFKCSGHMILREGKYGKFLGCSNYPKCTETLKYCGE